MTDISYILRQCTITSTKQIHDIQQQQNVVKKKHNAIYSTLRSSRDIKLTVQRRGKEIELELTKDESGKFGFEITRTSDCLTVSQSNNAKLQIGDRIINAVSEGNGISNSADQGTGSNQCFLETARIKTEKQEALFKELDNHIREEV